MNRANVSVSTPDYGHYFHLDYPMSEGAPLNKAMHHANDSVSTTDYGQYFHLDYPMLEGADSEHVAAH